MHDLDFFDECLVEIAGNESKAAIKVTGMPGKHVPPGPGGVAGKMNDLLGAVSFFPPLISRFLFSFLFCSVLLGDDGARKERDRRVQAGYLTKAQTTQVPPTNGWLLELGHLTSSPSPSSATDGFRPGYRIYVSGDTLLVPELSEIPKRYPDIDLMLVHLGGTTIPSPSVPLLMVTMDAAQGVELVRLVGPDVTIPVHYE